MVDGWTDKKGSTLLNFLVNCLKGTMFVESIDASSYSKDAEKMFKLIDIRSLCVLEKLMWSRLSQTTMKKVNYCNLKATTIEKGKLKITMRRVIQSPAKLTSFD